MKIVFLETEGWEKEYLKGRFGKKVKVSYIDKNIKEINIDEIKDAEVISPFIYSNITKKIIDEMPKLKLIVTRSTGFDHVDINACKKKGIWVCNVPTYGENTVAEHTFGLILSLSRKIHKAYEKTVKGNYNSDDLRGFDLKAKTIGVIGTGHIGRHVIRIAKGFDMDIVAYDTFPDKDLEKEYGIEYLKLDDLLKKSDIITVHLPLLKKTKHLINMKNIKKIKQGALLINTSRGAIVETDALSYAIEKGILGGAGLDVIEGEEMIKEEAGMAADKFSKQKLKILLKDHVLFKQDNVIFTPHIAFNSVEAVQRILETTAKNIEGFIENKIINEVGIR